MPTPEYCLFGLNWWPLCMTKAEWSGWAQAIGAAAAIFFAVRIAGTQERQRRREAVTVAGVTAALVTFMLIEMRAAVLNVQSVNLRLANQLPHDGILEFLGAANRFVAVPLPSEEQLVRLSASPHTHAARLAELCTRITFAKQTVALIDLSRDDEMNTAEFSARAAAIDQLNQIGFDLVAAQTALEEFRSALTLSPDLRSQPTESWEHLQHRLSLRVRLAASRWRR